MPIARWNCGRCRRRRTALAGLISADAAHCRAARPPARRRLPRWRSASSRPAVRRPAHRPGRCSTAASSAPEPPRSVAACGGGEHGRQRRRRRGRAAGHSGSGYGRIGRRGRSTARSRAAVRPSATAPRHAGFSGGVCSGLVEPNIATCGTAECRRDVHQARIVAGHAARTGEQRHRIEQRSSPPSDRQAPGESAWRCGAMPSHTSRSLADPSSTPAADAAGAALPRVPHSAPPASIWPGRIRRRAQRRNSRRAAARCAAATSAMRGAGKTQPRPRRPISRRQRPGQCAVEGDHRRPSGRIGRRCVSSA